MINELAFRIKKNGKPGSNCFCTKPELIENYHKAIEDTSQIWECHYRLEFMPFSGKNCTMKRLIELGMYYNVQPEALIFLRKEEHRLLHKEQFTTKNWKASPDQKLKNSTTNKGKNGKWIKGRKWYNNGIINVRAFECPKGFSSGYICKK